MKNTKWDDKQIKNNRTETVNNQTAVMGELALLEEEVNPVIDELRKGNLG